MRGFVLRILVPLGVVLIGVLITLSIAGAFGGSGSNRDPQAATLGVAAAPSSGFATHVQVIPPPKSSAANTVQATTPAGLSGGSGTTPATGTTLESGVTGATGLTGSTSAATTKPKTVVDAHAKTPAKPKATTVTDTPAKLTPAPHTAAPVSTARPITVTTTTRKPTTTKPVTKHAPPAQAPVVEPIVVPPTSTTPAASTTKPSSLSGPPGLQAPGG